MASYTKTGDDGTTGRPGGRRVRKSDPLVEANGTVDELNAHLGLCLAQARGDGVEEVREALAPVQSELLTVGALLAAVGADGPAGVSLDAAVVERMERHIDEAAAALPPLASFILPRGTELGCRLHAARSVCRRAERVVVAAADAGADVPPVVLRYLNRLGDLLFALARRANRAGGAEEEPWRH
jgi:cob(I)alamin adenosyltransferase